jgi:transposase
MLRPNAPDLKVYLHRAPIDMRRGRNGLAAIVQQVMQQDPFRPAYFLFINKKHNALKILSWDINGFGLWHKLIESREKFPWPRLFEEDVVELTSEQLHWLMDGYDVWARPHKPVTFTHVS